MNYQYRFGTSFSAATRTLHADGGFIRYYQGMGAALIQGNYLKLYQLQGCQKTDIAQVPYLDLEIQQPTPESSLYSNPTLTSKTSHHPSKPFSHLSALHLSA